MSSDVHALSGAYAVHALDHDERSEFEKHLATCESCRHEVESLTEAAASLADLGATQPPARLRAAVMADITNVRPLAPRRRQTIQAAASRRVLRPLLVAAAVAVLGGGAAVVATHPWTSTGSTVQEALAEQVIGAQDVQVTRRHLANGATVTLYRSVSLGRAAVTSTDMPLPPAGRVYELWVEDAAGAMHPAGLMPHRESATVLVRGSGLKDRGVGITVEPAGGSAQPTSQPVALLPFVSA